MKADDDQTSDESRTDPGSAGYPAGTPGYPAAGEDSAEREPFWSRYGFDSREEYLRQFIGEQDRLSRNFGLGGKSEALLFLGDSPPEDRPEVTPPPGDEIGDVASAKPDARRTRQIGTKLKARDFELLCAAAREYGVAPSTMARMFVVRGARAVEERRSRPEAEAEDSAA